MREQIKTAILLSLFGYIVFLFGFTVGEFSERSLYARRLAAVVVRAASEKPDDDPVPPTSNGE